MDKTFLWIPVDTPVKLNIDWVENISVVHFSISSEMLLVFVRKWQNENKVSCCCESVSITVSGGSARQYSLVR